MAGLERYHGHFYNWYDISTLEPLRPTYVSTVDSGNLAGHLLVLRVALLEASESPLLGEQVLRGAFDTVQLALEDLVSCQETFDAPGEVRALRESLDGLARAIELADGPESLGEWSSQLVRIDALAAETAELLEALRAHVRGQEGAPLTACEHVAVPVTPLQALEASLADVRRSIAEPLGLLRDVAPWASSIAESPAVPREDAALAPLFAFVPSLAGLAEGLGTALSRLDDLARGGDDAETRAWAATRPGGDPGGAPALRPAARPAAARRRHRARDVGAHRLRDALRPAPPAVLDRLQPQRGPAGRELLRPAGQRMPPRELPRDREGRRAPGALVPPGPLAHQDR